MNIIIIILCILSICYALPYANWEYKQKNKIGAVMIYMTALTLLILITINFFI